MKVLIIEKNGDLKEVSTKTKIKIDELYKKCKFRNTNNFGSRNIWSYNGIFISLFAKGKGRASTENKYELPPPLDSKLYFGNMVVIAHKRKDYNFEDEIIDMTKEMWESFYNKAMGGFESLGDEDSFSEEEEHPKEDLTKNGYLKDGFVVDDDAELETDEDDEDYIPDCDDISSHSSDVSMTQEELEAAYGNDSEVEEEEEEDEEYDDDDEEEDENKSDSELEEESYIYK